MEWNGSVSSRRRCHTDNTTSYWMTYWKKCWKTACFTVGKITEKNMDIMLFCKVLRKRNLVINRVNSDWKCFWNVIISHIETFPYNSCLHPQFCPSLTDKVLVFTVIKLLWFTSPPLCVYKIHDTVICSCDWCSFTLNVGCESFIIEEMCSLKKLTICSHWDLYKALIKYLCL